MDETRQTTARICLEAAERGTMAFPEIVATLAAAGFESYAVDFRRSIATYYLPDGDCVSLPSLGIGEPVAATFDTARVQAAIREAQENAPGYSYAGFCRKVVAAGCAGYVVSFAGRRALYLGRTAETHVEHFPT